MTRAEALAIRQKVIDGEAAAKAGGIRTEQIQSDKLGSDWVNTYVNDILVMQEYIEQENPFGVEANPITYYDGVPLINNAFYMKDGKLQVYVAGDWVEW